MFNDLNPIIAPIVIDPIIKPIEPVSSLVAPDLPMPY